MRTGRLVFQGPLEELRGPAPRGSGVETADPAAAAAVLNDLGLPDTQVTGHEVTAQLGDFEPERICAGLVHAGSGSGGWAS